jgi:hypothetical protein
VVEIDNEFFEFSLFRNQKEVLKLWAQLMEVTLKRKTVQRLMLLPWQHH